MGLGIFLAIILGGFAMLRQAESKPSRCPTCGNATLLADRAGRLFRCVPCQSQFVYFGATLIPYHGRHRDVPTATLREPED